MKRAWIIARNDLLLLLRSNTAWVWFLAMPLVYTFFFGLAFRGGDPPPQQLLVRDLDGGFLARALTEELLHQGQKVILLKTDKPSNRAAFLIIPQDFTEKVLAGKAAELELKHPGSDRIDTADVEAHLNRAIIRVIGNLCLMADRRPLDNPNGTGPSGRTGGLAQAYGLVASTPPQVTLRTESAGEIKRPPSGFLHTLPGMVVMFVLLCVLIHGTHALVEEKDSGALRRLSAAPVLPRNILAGKLLGRMVPASLQVLILLGAGKLLFGVPFGPHPEALVLVLLPYVAFTACMGLLAASLIRRREHVTGICLLITLTMAGLGGCWWPLEVMPNTARAAAFFFPTGWAMDGLHKVMAFGYGSGAVWIHAAAQTGGALVCFLLAARIMRRARG